MPVRRLAGISNDEFPPRESDEEAYDYDREYCTTVSQYVYVDKTNLELNQSKAELTRHSDLK